MLREKLDLLEWKLKQDKDEWEACIKDMEELIESSEFMQQELKTLWEDDIHKNEKIQWLEKEIFNSQKEV